MQLVYKNNVRNGFNLIKITVSLPAKIRVPTKTKSISHLIQSKCCIVSPP